MLTKFQVKYIQSLNEKKFRNEANVFVAEGPKIINELLASANVQPVSLYATNEWLQDNEVIKNCPPSVDVFELATSELERISFFSTPHQVMGIFRQPVFQRPLSFRNTILLLLDGIQDPGNFGTIVRIADWFGIYQIVAGKDCVDIFNAKVVQSTMGSIARVNILYEDIHDFIKQHNDIPVYASSLQGRPLSAFKNIKEGMLLIGNESRGVNEELLKSSDYQINIPKFGRAESLNAAVATGIILSHVLDHD